MASGKITVTNFTDQTIGLYIAEDEYSQNGVASGSVTSTQSQPFLVSGYEAYQIEFTAETSGGNYSVTGVAPNTEVSLDISNSSAGGDDS